MDQSRQGRNHYGYQLHLSDIPEGVTRLEIKEYFSEYGQILKYYLDPSGTWGNITFASKEEADTALKELNRTPPLMLTVMRKTKRRSETNDFHQHVDLTERERRELEYLDKQQAKLKAKLFEAQIQAQLADLELKKLQVTGERNISDSSSDSDFRNYNESYMCSCFLRGNYKTNDVNRFVESDSEGSVRSQRTTRRSHSRQRTFGSRDDETAERRTRSRSRGRLTERTEHTSNTEKTMDRNRSQNGTGYNNYQSTGNRNVQVKNDNQRNDSSYRRSYDHQKDVGTVRNDESNRSERGNSYGNRSRYSGDNVNGKFGNSNRSNENNDRGNDYGHKRSVNMSEKNDTENNFRNGSYNRQKTETAYNKNTATDSHYNKQNTTSDSHYNKQNTTLDSHYNKQNTATDSHYNKQNTATDSHYNKQRAVRENSPRENKENLASVRLKSTHGEVREKVSPVKNAAKNTENATAVKQKSTQREIFKETSAVQAKPPCLVTKKLPEGVFSEVQVQWIEPNTENIEGWVQLVSEQDLLLEIMTYLLETELKKVAPVVGAPCAAKYDGVWYRAVVEKTSPKLCVRYTDYGNTNVEDLDEVRELSGIARSTEMLAVRIRLAEGSNCKLELGTELKIKPVGKEGDITIVHTENGSYGAIKKSPSPLEDFTVLRKPHEPLPSKTTPPSIVEQLKPGLSGVLEMKTLFSNRQGIVRCISEKFQKEAATLSKMSGSYSSLKSSNYVPTKGEIVCVWNNDVCERAYVVGDSRNGKWDVALIDTGIFLNSIDTIEPLKSPYDSVPKFACTCFVHANSIVNHKSFNEVFKLRSMFKFTVKEIEDNRVTCTINDIDTDAQICEAVLTAWNPLSSPALEPSPKKKIDVTKSSPTLEPSPKLKKDVPMLVLKSKEKVMVTLGRNQRSFYVRNREAKKNLDFVRTELNLYAAKCPPLKLPLKSKEWVSCKYSIDGLWYRGCVLNNISVGDTNVEIVFADYGHKETVDIKDLRELPESVRQCPISIIKVVLADLPEEPLTSDQENLLELYYDNPKHKFIAEFKIGADTDTVLYFENSEKTLNSELKSVTKTSSKPKSPRESADETLNSSARTPVKKEIPVEKLKAPVSPVKKTVESAVVETKIGNSSDKEPVDIQVQELPLGKTEIIFLSTVPDVHTVVMCCVKDFDLLKEVTEDLSLEMLSYVENCPEQSFIPAMDAYCLAQFEGFWYRAMCLSELLDDGTILVMFIDFGNISSVKPEECRKIPPRFAVLKALANYCNILDLPDELTASQIELLNSLLEQNKLYDAEVVSKEDEIYSIRFPHVTKAFN